MTQSVEIPVTRVEQWGDKTVEVTYLSGVTHEEWAVSPRGERFMRRAEMRHREEMRVLEMEQ